MSDEHPHLPAGPSRRGLLGLSGRVATAAGLGALTTRGAYKAFGAGPVAGRSPAPDPGSAAPPSFDRELRVGYLPITDASALLMAHEGGFFREAGLPSARPVMFRSWESLAQAFVVGEVDVVHLLLPFALQLRLASKAPIKVIGWGHTNGSALTVRPTITRTEQLAGGTVAIPYWWSIHSVLLQRILAANGLRPVIGQRASASAGTVELVVMAPADMVPALAAGTIAGFVVAEPFCSVAEIKQVGRVLRFLGDVWQDHACCAVAVRQDLIDRHPTAVQAVAEGLLAAQDWLGGHRHEAGGILTTTAGYLPQPAPAVHAVFNRDPGRYADVTTHADWHGERLAFSPFPHASYTAALVDLMRRTAVDGDTRFLADLDPATVHGQLVDDRFVRAALGPDRDRLTQPRLELIQP